MGKVRLLHDNVTRESYFQEVATGRQFRRMVGALAWPYATADGSVIVLGELRGAGTVLGGRRSVFVLEERRSGDVPELFEHMGSMQDAWLVRTWATPITDHRAWMLDDFNDERRRKRLPRLTVTEPQGLRGKGEGQIPFYHALVQRRTSGEKTLFLGSHCTAGADIGRFEGDWAATAKVVECPGAAALFFALVEIDINPLPQWGERRQGNKGPADALGGY